MYNKYFICVLYIFNIYRTLFLLNSISTLLVQPIWFSTYPILEIYFIKMVRACAPSALYIYNVKKARLVFQRTDTQFFVQSRFRITWPRSDHLEIFVLFKENNDNKKWELHEQQLLFISKLCVCFLHFAYLVQCF